MKLQTKTNTQLNENAQQVANTQHNENALSALNAQHNEDLQFTASAQLTTKTQTNASAQFGTRTQTATNSKSGIDSENDIIRLSSIKKSFGRRLIIDNLSVGVKFGEMLAICGSSGTGKSTLLNIMGLLEPYDFGEYCLFGAASPKPDTRAAQRCIRNEISYLFQNFALVDDRTVKDNLGIALYNTKMLPKEKLEAMEYVLHKVGLDGFLNARIFELSGGEQQRVAIARCLLKPSRLVLADEPTGSLDDRNRDEIIQMLKDINATGKTVVIVTHDPVVAGACNRTIELTQPSHKQVPIHDHK
ncbi:MAG: ATP-binding cassette domain-containing protein [Coriobacteriales bacterium]|jgi:putative ABC transport system ATP-binding protein|nr:ATP-binding cassette domain-containing protein [Coriobacteriales bacterium]